MPPACGREGAMADKKKIIAIDFDGVIHSYKSGWQGADVIPDAPVPGAIEWLGRLLEDERFEVAIFSSRNHQAGGSKAMFLWLLSNGLPLHLADKLDMPDVKPAAHLTIDDRAFCFTGSFPLPDEIANFEPWWKAVR